MELTFTETLTRAKFEELNLDLFRKTVVVRQRKAWRRRDGLFLYFEVHVSS